MDDRLIIGISGASGAPIAIKLLKALRKTSVETHLIITKGGEETIKAETELAISQVSELSSASYDNGNIGAAIASGSFKTRGMIVVPCSMKTVAGIYSGYSDNLLLRGADATLKEHRKLVLVTRECPLSEIHLRNMYELSRCGAVILPPVLSYYNKPQTIDDATEHIVGKILDQFGIEYDRFCRWRGV
ncbi:MAG: UbiX family flavin prenyltransferase [Clostridiales bacterium]|jgi:4-hydroxy-3-polyprenylbenzoate decarboxylase|nr:UbiX family flavin prenyltransferase [Clostridiales bacterium]